MKNLTLCLLVFILFSCTESNERNFNSGVEYYEKENYSEAYRNFNKVDTSSTFHTKAENYIKKIDSITEQLEKIEAEKKLANDLKNSKELSTTIKTRHKEVVDYSSASSITIEIAKIKAWKQQIEEFENLNNKEINKNTKSAKRALINYQINRFPKLRNAYGKNVKKIMWEHDIEVNRYKKTLTFTGGIFAANKNKQDFMNQMSDAVHDLRFKRINFKWYKYDDEYTYYTLKTKNDNEF